jgi:hypothetical protein
LGDIHELAALIFCEEKMKKMNVYLEAGEKKVFACAIDWPGWCRAGRDEASALQALLDYAPRYAGVLRAAGVPFTPPKNIDGFSVMERVKGDAGTDFGAPHVVPICDAASISAKELPHLQALLNSYWQAFDDVAERAEGKALRTGPRGGGRDLQKMAAHVMESEASYLSRLAWKAPKLAGADFIAQQTATRKAVLDALASVVQNGLPESGPRGGKIWPARYFIRRAGWHVLDHIWEIEDRLQN